jgi:hypothetical protein
VLIKRDFAALGGTAIVGPNYQVSLDVEFRSHSTTYIYNPWNLDHPAVAAFAALNGGTGDGYS